MVAEFHRVTGADRRGVGDLRELPADDDRHVRPRITVQGRAGRANVLAATYYPTTVAFDSVGWALALDVSDRSWTLIGGAMLALLWTPQQSSRPARYRRSSRAATVIVSKQLMGRRKPYSRKRRRRHRHTDGARSPAETVVAQACSARSGSATIWFPAQGAQRDGPNRFRRPCTGTEAGRTTSWRSAFQAHVELLQLFLARRDEIVERIQGVLNAQRKPTQYLPKRPPPLSALRGLLL